MDNITNLPSCKECNRILKNKDINENGLCPKCLSKTINTEIADVSEIKSEEIDTKEYEMSINAHSESQSMPEPIKVETSTLKPGQAVRDRFMELVSKGLITEEYIFELSSKEGTAKSFGVRYPFLLEYDSAKTVKEQAYINGHSRYTSKPVTIGDRQYLITNDIYANSVSKFIAWADSLDK